MCIRDRFFTESVLLGLTKQHGFQPAGKSDLCLSDEELTACEPDDIFSASGSITHSYLEWLKQFTDPNAETAFFFRAFEKAEHAEPAPVQTGEETPFLLSLIHISRIGQHAQTAAGYRSDQGDKGGVPAKEPGRRSDCLLNPRRGDRAQIRGLGEHRR